MLPSRLRLCRLHLRGSPLLTQRRQAASQPPPLSRGLIFSSGAAGGCLGGLVGLGGGAIMVPMMTGFAGFSQHAAVGTSSAAVASTGLAGCLSFASAGRVDFVAAAAVASTAMLGARWGARFTARFAPSELQRGFALFQLLVAPLVPIKGYLVRQTKQQPERPPSRVQTQQLLKLAVIGIGSGVASGMFGIGGGVVVTPALCLLTEMEHSAVLGTTLTSMVPPGLVSAFTHYRMGNVTVAAVLPLCVGSACGAILGGQLAVHAPSELPLQLLFGFVIGGMGGRKLWALRSKA